MYLIGDTTPSGPLTPPRSPGSPARSPAAVVRVAELVNAPLNPSSSRPTGQNNDENGDAIKVPSPEVTPEPKKVHWTASIQDNQGKTNRKPKPRHSRQGDEKRPSSSKSRPRTKLPSVPDAPRSRGPPPAPRPQRLPTPDLPDLKCEDFCDCCYEGTVSKMDAQRKIVVSLFMNPYTDPRSGSRCFSHRECEAITATPDLHVGSKCRRFDDKIGNIAPIDSDEIGMD